MSAAARRDMMTAALLGQNTDSRTLATVVASLVIARFLFHAFYVPTFEGPDEPFHLSRAVVIAREPLRDAVSEPNVAPEIVAAMRAYPCGGDLHRAFGCPTFAGRGAFNIVGAPQSGTPDSHVQNYEAHQPPLFYVASGLLLRIAGAGSVHPARQLLIIRIFAVAVAAAAMILTLRTSLGGVAFFLPLLLPGAAESIARGANDAFLFAWTALAWVALQKKSRALILLAAIGPLIKLTAFPIVAVAATWLWLQRERRLALLTAFGSLLVFPLQALRGWAWGGTLEANLPTGAIAESATDMAVGFARSMYTFAKTTFWLGEWSFFRAPLWLVGAFFLMLVAFALTLRWNRDRSRAVAHGVGLLVAVAGLVTFAVLHRRLFGTWGGVGGWYAWGWYPWLAALCYDLFTAPRGRMMASVFIVFILIANVAWFAAATRLYGF